MTASYDFISIVVDDDWGLLGIVPPNNAGDRIKKIYPSADVEFSKSSSPEQKDLHSDKESVLTPDPSTPRKFPKAKVINSHQKPIIRDTKSDPLITPGESNDTPIDVKKKELAQNVLSGFTSSPSRTSRVSAEINSDFDSGFGSINRLAATRSRDNLLIGFGRR